MYAIEYHCPQCKSRHSGRYFKRPDADDLDRYSRASRLAQLVESPYLPQEAIPEGDETNRLHRWGYRAYTDLFNARQIVSLVRLCELVADVPSTRVREALATNVSDLLRYQNMLCRYDSVALKSLDIFSVHGFPVGLQQCESNILGIPKGGSSNIGSGGWTNIVTKFAAAKQYCEHPYEVSNRTRIHTTGERIGGTRFGESSRRTKIECASATDLSLPHGSVAAVLTDPPYFANVQYAELMDFCYVWLRRIMGESGEFSQDSTRNPMELTGNETLGRGLGEFAAGLSEAFSRAAAALVPGGPFVFTYHHNSSSGYWPVIIALLDAGLTCTVSIPCPAEMGASIHINGTGSSTVDSVFVCRSTGSVGRRLLVMDASGYSSLITNEARLLEQSGLRVRDGDLRCMILGHLARMTVWNLRQGWDPHIPMQQKLALVETTQRKLPTWKEILALANHDRLSKPERLLHTAESEAACYGDDSIPF